MFPQVKDLLDHGVVTHRRSGDRYSLDVAHPLYSSQSARLGEKWISAVRRDASGPTRSAGDDADDLITLASFHDRQMPVERDPSQPDRSNPEFFHLSGSKHQHIPGIIHRNPDCSCRQVIIPFGGLAWDDAKEQKVYSVFESQSLAPKYLGSIMDFSS
jgi:hypothetical protein